MVEEREEGGDEDDGGQDLEGEDGAGVGPKQIAEGAGVGRPSWPKRTRVPAKVAESMELTTPPAQVMALSP